MWLTFSFPFLKDGIDYAEKNGMFFIETSAKTADNINQLFEVHFSVFYLFLLVLFICVRPLPVVTVKYGKHWKAPVKTFFLLFPTLLMSVIIAVCYFCYFCSL